MGLHEDRLIVHDEILVCQGSAFEKFATEIM